MDEVSEKSVKSLSNLVPFKKGNDPRRGRGPSKGTIFITPIIKRLARKRVICLDEIEGRTRRMTAAEKYVIKLFALAWAGDIQAIKELNDRLDGKAMQHMEIGGVGGVPLMPPTIIFEANKNE